MLSALKYTVVGLSVISKAAAIQAAKMHAQNHGMGDADDESLLQTLAPNTYFIVCENWDDVISPFLLY